MPHDDTKIKHFSFLINSCCLHACTSRLVGLSAAPCCWHTLTDVVRMLNNVIFFNFHNFSLFSTFCFSRCHLRLFSYMNMHICMSFFFVVGCWCQIKNSLTNLIWQWNENVKKINEWWWWKMFVLIFGWWWCKVIAWLLLLLLLNSLEL